MLSYSENKKSLSRLNGKRSMVSRTIIHWTGSRELKDWLSVTRPTYG